VVCCRIALAFETLTPKQVCQAFERALDRRCDYVFDPKIEIRVPIPAGYKEQLEGIEVLFGRMRAPYFPGPEFDYPERCSIGNEPDEPDGTMRLTTEARSLWRGYRGVEEYFREAFLIEEQANGREWMTVDKKVT